MAKMSRFASASRCGLKIILFYFQMGFNRGRGLEFTPLPLSSNVDQLFMHINSGSPSVMGRFVYKVSGTTIVQGGCARGPNVPGQGKCYT